MAYTEKRTEEWEVEMCSNCHHERSMHMKPANVMDTRGEFMYRAEGCMVVIRDGRRLAGDNPYPRCACLECV